MNFNDKSVLVTGASRGIGRVIAHHFARAGARVIIHYNRNLEAAQETLATMKSNDHIILQANLEDPQDVKHLMDTAIEAVGKIDILINNAGIYQLHPIQEYTYEQWQDIWGHIIGTNLMGAANISFLMVKHFMNQGGGTIVNVSSRGAFRGEPEAPAYGASKAGMNAMSQSMAKALAPHNIFVFVVAPGFVETEMAAPYLEGPEGEAIRNQSPLGRVAKPEEVARTVLFLASEGSDYLTGCVVDINGASYLRT
jgi:3-oxoacyl-[acyl-carrier protein] reductase